MRLLLGGNRLLAHDLRALLHRAGTRRIHITKATRNPDALFTTQQARNLYVAEELPKSVRFLIRDRGSKYTRSFDAVFETEGTRVIPTPVCAPKANAFAERWVRTVRSEILDWTLVLGRRHLDHLLARYAEHYNSHRPHRGIELAAPDSCGMDPPAAAGQIRCRQVVAGINEYLAARARRWAASSR